MPGAMLVLAGMTVMEVRVTGVDLFPPPHPVSIKTVMSTTKQLIAMLLIVDNTRITLDMVLDFTNGPNGAGFRAFVECRLKNSVI